MRAWLVVLLAPSFLDLTNREFTLDGHQGGVVSSYRIVGMGGVAIGTAEGAASMANNPASPAVRPATSNDRWDWDITFDAMTPSLGEDFDNNGVPQGDDGTTHAENFGLLGQVGPWALGVYGATERRTLTLSGGAPGHLDLVLSHVLLARSFRRDELTVGIGFVGGRFQLYADDPATTLVDEDAGAFEAGMLWRPPGGDWRLGATVRLPASVAVEPQGCDDPLDCGGYILPGRFAVPWNAGVGFAWRRAGTRWNQKVKDDWRDERGLIVAADVLLTGGVAGGAGVEAFVNHQLQASGRHVALSVRAGAEYEWVPGWFRVRGGAYFEPGRFEGVGGRMHFTSGLDVRIWSFCFWDDRYRLRFSLAADVASGYANAMTSLGFWH